MDIQKINWRVYIDESSRVDPDDFFKAFNTWIPDSPEVFVDVVDYKHVQDGPLVWLAGHHVDFALDGTGRRLSLLLSVKTPQEGGNEQKVAGALLKVLQACERLEAAPELGGKVRFKAGELDFLINDRAIAPNNEATDGVVRPVVKKVLDSVFGPSAYALERKEDTRQRYTLAVVAQTPKGIQDLISGLTVIA